MNFTKPLFILAILASLGLVDGVSQAQQVTPTPVAPVAPVAPAVPGSPYVASVNPYLRSRVWNRRVRPNRRNRLRRAWVPGMGWVRQVY